MSSDSVLPLPLPEQQGSLSRRRVLILVNPHAGGRSRPSLIDGVVSRLRQNGLQVDCFTAVDALAAAVLEAQRGQELRAVVCAGGDGTLALVANRTAPGTPLAILPLGTENLFARFLGLKPIAATVCRTIVDAYHGRFDVGQANGRLFLLMASCGFDAEVVRKMHASRRGHIRHWSYIKPIGETIRTYCYPELRVWWEPETWHASSSWGPGAVESLHSLPPACEPLRVRWLFATNVPKYAGGLRLSPLARGDDGLLDVCTFRHGSLWHGLRYLLAVTRGRQTDLQDCVQVRTVRFRVESTEPVPYQLDGDPGGWLPLEVSILPRRLTMLVPYEFTVGVSKADSSSSASGPS
jgi:diacylglycerol kinase (ATP)